MRLLPGIGSALALAIRRTNARYHALPPDRRPDVIGETWSRLERNIDAACSAGDAELALQAIRDWEEHALREFRRAAL
jgi:hypothetical protein